ncbi:MAG: FecR family protein [Coraliomargaritaceae bacterium]
MKNHNFYLLALLFLLGSLCAHASDLASAKVLKVTGNVLKYDADGGNVALEEGDILKEGDGITTSFSSSVDLIFSNGTELTLVENSSVSFEEMSQEPFSGDETYEELNADPSRSQTLLQLNYGQVDGHVKKLREGSKFEVNTPLGTAAIRGTIFKVALTFNINTGSITLNITNVDGLVNLLSPFVESEESVEYDSDRTSDNDVSADMVPSDLDTAPTTVCSVPPQNTIKITIPADNAVFDLILTKETNVSPRDSIAVAAISGDAEAVAQEIADAGIEVESPQDAAEIAKAVVSAAVASAAPAESADTTETAANTVVQALATIASDTNQDVVEIVEAASSGSTTGAVQAAVATAGDINRDGVIDSKDVVDVVEAASSGASSGAIEAAVTTGSDVVAVAQASSTGATSGAVQAAAESGTDVVDVTEAASAGSTSGAVEAAVAVAGDTNNDGVVDAKDVVDVVEASSNGATSGAIEGAEASGANVNNVSDAAANGATTGAIEGVEESGVDVDVNDVTDAANTGAEQGSEGTDTGTDSGTDPVITPEEPLEVSPSTRQGESNRPV